MQKEQRRKALTHHLVPLCAMFIIHSKKILDLIVYIISSICAKKCVQHVYKEIFNYTVILKYDSECPVKG